LFVFTALIFSVMAWAQAPSGPKTMVYVFPKMESETGDHRFDDIHEILQMALEKTAPNYGPYSLKSSDIGMNEARYMHELRSGKMVNIAWSSTSTRKEEEYIPIRIPLRKGILGYRLLLISRERQKQIAKIKTKADLSRFTIGQGIGWGDVELYRYNGINVIDSGYDNLFQMVTKKRVDIFPRGINEIFLEYESRKKQFPGLMIEPSLALYYPWPYYFFLPKSEKILAERVEKGLRLMLKDGSFEKIFWKYNGEAIEKADLGHRRIIYLQNPLLPKSTPLQDKTLWLNPVQK